MVSSKIKKHSSHVRNNLHSQEEFGLVPFLTPMKYGFCYPFLASNRMIFLTEEITKETSNAFNALLLYYDKQSSKEWVNIYISSPGGDAGALTSMYSMLQYVRCPIRTICIGKAYSAAAFILASGKKGERYMTENACVMIHGLQCAFPVSTDAQKSETYYTFLNMLNNNIMKILAKHVNKPIDKVLADCKNDLFLDAKETIKYGIADHIL